MPIANEMNDEPCGAAAPQTRLSPEMASFRNLVLGFVRRYLAEHGVSPSYGEIAAGVGSHRVRVHRAIKVLVRDQLLERRPGPRGLMLPNARSEAMRKLAALGWYVDEARGLAIEPGVTHCILPMVPVLDYPAYRSAGDVPRPAGVSHIGKAQKKDPCREGRGRAG